MTDKIIANRYGALALGAILLAIGIGLFVVNSGTVRCGAQEMHPGDECSTTRRGRTTVSTYEEQRDKNAFQRNLLTGGGAVVFLVGVAGIVLKARRRSETPAA